LAATATLAAASTAMVVTLAAVAALTAVFATAALLAFGAWAAAATVFTAEAAAAATLPALTTVALSTASAAMMTTTATATLTTITVETAFAAGVGLIGRLLGSGGFAAEEAFDPGDQAAFFLFGRRSDRRRGAGLFFEAAWLAGLALITRVAWFTGVARIAGLARFTLIARVARLALFAEVTALLWLRGLVGAGRFAAGGGGTVLGGLGVALAVAFGAEDRAITAAIAGVLVVVGLLSTGGERVALPALGRADFVLGWEDFELGLFGGLSGCHGS
jgi:hypothetical protein